MNAMPGTSSITAKKPPSAKPGWEFAREVLVYLLQGKLWVGNGHRPPAGHIVPEDFAGVGVATSEDPAVDEYVIARLRKAGLRHVRLDFAYGDAERAAGSFLDALCGQSFHVMLHLVQPFDAARKMESEPAREEWRNFVSATLDRFGNRVNIVEIGSTINRKRWAGYTLSGFLSMWEIAHSEVRARGLRLAGPSVTDFEPLFNIGFLALLQRRGQLPDIHTDNLFSERCTEPERYDHKIFGPRLASLIRVNLVKKARLLQKIGADFGVPTLCSPAAFWTLPRIERMLPRSEEKQADYLSRYMVLCAASGALGQAWWGPLVCHREGLVDDGVSKYPALERITHYASVTGALSNFRERPSLLALKTFAKLIPGARYEGRLNASDDLEVHAFCMAERTIHAVWTINGRAAALADIYDAGDLDVAEFISRDGNLLTEGPTLAGESPVYLCWKNNRPVAIQTSADVLKGLAINWHAPGMTYFIFRENGWQGMLLARDAAEASLLLQAIHPERMTAPSRETTLRHARNAIWSIDDPRRKGGRLVAKQPVKMHLHKKFLDRFKPSKGLRSWSGTNELLRRNIDAAAPVAYFEKTGDITLTQNYYVCEHVDAEFSARELFSAFARGEAAYEGVAEADAYRQLCDYLLAMHGRGIFFRDLSGGNILIRKEAEGKLKFCLIDTGRLHAFNRPLPIGKRVSDLVRICNKLHWPGREQLVGLYMAGLGRNFGWWQRLPFLLYDMKVVLKRNFGRKKLKRLVTSR
jgi:hypothetical protein